MLSADIVFGAALAVMIVIDLVYGPRIPSDRVAMQWSTDGIRRSRRLNPSRCGRWSPS